MKRRPVVVPPSVRDWSDEENEHGSLVYNMVVPQDVTRHNYDNVNSESNWAEAYNRSVGRFLDSPDYRSHPNPEYRTINGSFRRPFAGTMDRFIRQDTAHGEFGDIRTMPSINPNVQAVNFAALGYSGPSLVPTSTLLPGEVGNSDVYQRSRSESTSSSRSSASYGTDISLPETPNKPQKTFLPLLFLGIGAALGAASAVTFQATNAKGRTTVEDEYWKHQSAAERHYAHQRVGTGYGQAAVARNNFESASAINTHAKERGNANAWRAGAAVNYMQFRDSNMAFYEFKKHQGHSIKPSTYDRYLEGQQLDNQNV